jgi:hypothetical protein
MDRRQKLVWILIAVAAAILTYQLFIPPIVGLADQGDFARIIGTFGYAPADRSATIAFVAEKYIPDPAARKPEWEQPSSEYLFAACAILLNKIVSPDNRLDIAVIGAVHVLAFLAAFARLLLVTKQYRASPILWIIGLVALTDVGYAAYWNSFYAEPASCIFFLLLAAESIAIYNSDQVSPRQIVLWSLWAIFFVMAKAQNAPLGILLTLFSVRLWWWTKERVARRLAILASTLIAAATLFNIVTIPARVQWADAYNHMFLAILPESRNPPSDLKAFGLEPALAKYSGTGAWSPGSAFHDMVESGLLGKQITHAAIVRFYLQHPARIWRHAKTLLPIAFSLRPEWCGNFERTAGRPPGARSAAFTLWSGFHEQVLRRIGKLILILLCLSPAIAATAWIRFPARRRHIELFALLSICCLTAFLVAALGDAWDNVKHLFLFNLMLDACLILATGVVTSRPPKDRPSSNAALANDD